MPSEIKELDVVTLEVDYDPIKEGEQGTVVHLHGDKIMAEVEFDGSRVVTIPVFLLGKE